MTPEQQYTADNILHTSVDEAKRIYIPDADSKVLAYCIEQESKLIQPRQSLIQACESRSRSLTRKRIKDATDLAKALRNGADIGGYLDAMAIRWLEFQYPELVDVCGPMGQYKVTEPLPKLGAILKPEGRKNFEKVVECLDQFMANPDYERSKWKKQE